MATHLRFITDWAFEAPIEAVWALLDDPERYPSWWPGFQDVTTVSGDGGIGTVTAHHVNVGFGLALRFRMVMEETRPLEYSRLSVSGDAVGMTEWRLEHDGGRTTVTHVWDVEVRKPLLRFMGRLPGATQFFAWRHNATMRGGWANVARLLSEGSGG